MYTASLGQKATVAVLRREFVLTPVGDKEVMVKMKAPQSEKPKKPHALNIESRSKGLVSGVEKVVSANETALLLETSAGGLHITGGDLRIHKFDMDSGSLVFEGAVNGVRYAAAKIPLLKRIFR